MAPFELANPAGLYALLALLPLILLYLIRPRPKPMNIPSLMFFTRSHGSRRLTSFLRQITHDWLFLIQLILLAALALTFSEPFSTYQHDITASNTVIVLDVSASMQAKEGSSTRFAIGVAAAKKALGSKNSLILAKDTPYLALQDVTGEDVIRYLNALSPKDTASRIGEAIILAGEALGEGRVIVISDFINTGGQDPDIAKAVLETKGLVVDFINVAGDAKRNIGIVGLDAGADQTIAYIKNYNDRQEQITLQAGSTQERLVLSPLGTETYTFKTPPGITQLTIATGDDLAADDRIFLSAPKDGKARVLLIGNNESAFLRNALIASGELDLRITAPPIVPDDEFDVYILNQLDMDEVLPGTFEDILERVDAGATAIVTLQPDSPRINYQGLLPVTLGEKTDGGFINVEQLNRFTKNIDFGKSNDIITAEPRGDQTIIATVAGQPVITLKKQGAGKIIYYGIPEDADFKFSPHYPIFWTELMKYVTEQQDVRNLNLKTGETLLLDREQTIKTPTRTLTRAVLTLDEAGIYQLEDRTLAVNLVNELESNINPSQKIGVKSTDYELKPVKETRKFPWEIWLIALALFLLLFEIFFIKYRGDL